MTKRKSLRVGKQYSSGVMSRAQQKKNAKLRSLRYHRLPKFILAGFTEADMLEADKAGFKCAAQWKAYLDAKEAEDQVVPPVSSILRKPNSPLRKSDKPKAIDVRYEESRVRMAQYGPEEDEEKIGEESDVFDDDDDSDENELDEELDSENSENELLSEPAAEPLMVCQNNNMLPNAHSYMRHASNVSIPPYNPPRSIFENDPVDPALADATGSAEDEDFDYGEDEDEFFGVDEDETFVEDDDADYEDEDYEDEDEDVDYEDEDYEDEDAEEDEYFGEDEANEKENFDFQSEEHTSLSWIEKIFNFMTIPVGLIVYVLWSGVKNDRKCKWVTAQDDYSEYFTGQGGFRVCPLHDREKALNWVAAYDACDTCSGRRARDNPPHAIQKRVFNMKKFSTLKMPEAFSTEKEAEKLALALSAKYDAVEVMQQEKTGRGLPGYISIILVDPSRQDENGYHPVSNTSVLLRDGINIQDVKNGRPDYTDVPFEWKVNSDTLKLLSITDLAKITIGGCNYVPPPLLTLRNS